MSAASTASYSLPTSKTRLPVFTSQTTARPDWPPRPPPASSRPPLRLNLQDVDRALGERQHADQVVVGRLVEQDLLVPADGDERRPRAGRHARRSAFGLACGRRPARSSRFSGIAGGPSGLPIADGSSLNSNFGFALTDGHAAGVLERPALDPLAGSASISASGILGELGGMFGSSLCVTSWKSVLPSGSPGSIDLARAAALHRGAVGLEVQAALLLVGVVAGVAAFWKIGETWSW